MDRVRTPASPQGHAPSDLTSSGYPCLPMAPPQAGDFRHMGLWGALAPNHSNPKHEPRPHQQLSSPCSHGSVVCLDGLPALDTTFKRGLCAASFTQHRVYKRSVRWWASELYSFPRLSTVVVWGPHRVYPFIRRLTFGLFLRFGYCQ